MRYEKQLETLAKLRSDLVDRMSGSDSAALNRSPRAGGWSAAQVLAHVIQAERLSLEYLLKKTRKPEAIGRSGALEFAKSRALGLFLKLPIKVSAPARSADVPDHAELADLDREWEAVRSGWREFVGEFPSELDGKAVYKHPVAGRLNLEQTLKFLIDHLRRHARQIDRSLTEAASGAA